MNSFFCTMFAFMSLASCTVANNIKGNTYTLVEPKYSAEITLGFDKTDRYYGKIVNNYFGKYTINNNKIKFGQPGVTMMMGGAEEMKAESAYIKELQNEKTAEIKGNKLILTGSDGKKLIFNKK